MKNRVRVRRSVLVVLVALLAISTVPRAQVGSSVITGTNGTVFAGIGDLAGGGVGSAVRDATRVSGTIYAVGASTISNNTPAVPNLDTPTLWTWPGSGNGTLSALPTGVTLTTHPGNSISAYAITKLATFIASQAHYTDGSNTSNWVRVDVSQLPGGGNLNLSTASGTGAFAALAISENGATVYGQRTDGTANVATRYQEGVGGGFTQPPLPAGTAWSYPVPRGTSDSGLVMVGVASPTAFGGSASGVLPLATNTTAFRYEHNAVTGTGTTTVIPPLVAGGWNFPIAVTADGNVTLVAGNSAATPNGEVYLYNTPAIGPPTTTSLGSPNTAWTPRLLGGMTADGAVAVTFANSPLGGSTGISGLGLPPGAKYAYVHNSHGWFHLSSALAAQGIDLAGNGWDPTNLAVTGMRTVEGMDLVFGQGRKRTVGIVNVATGALGYIDGAVEGFVAEFPAGYLANFAVTPTPPTNRSIVGAWAFTTDPTNPATTNFVLAFMNDGTYYQINTTGFERGLYSWAADGSYQLWTRQATEGGGGSGANNGRLGRTVAISGDTLTFIDANCPGCAPLVFTRITGATSGLLGGWIVGDPNIDNNSAALVLTGASGTSGKYFLAQAFGDGNDHAEIGTWDWNSATLSWSAITTIQNGVVLTNQTGDPDPAHLTADELGLVLGTSPNIFSLRRILDPATVPPVITNPTLTASGNDRGVFAGYTVTATHGLTYSALGLPPGLTIDGATGQITGTPTQSGTFNVTIIATNSFGSTDSRTLVITIGPGPVSFLGIGDLPEGPGGVGSAVRDATRVGGALYAVGASTTTSVVTPLPNLDTPVMWTWTGGPTGALTSLPAGPNYPAGFLPGAPGDSITAWAINPFATQIASQAHNSSTNPPVIGTSWVRLAVSGLTNTLLGGATPTYVAMSLSDNGNVVYGQSSTNPRLVVRYDNGTITLPSFAAAVGLDPALAFGTPIPRGTSADGLVMVGVASQGTTSSNGFFTGTNGHAFRYVHGAVTPTTAIPVLTGGTWNFPIAVSAGGDVTLVAGNSTAVPNGEIYLYNTPVSGPVTTTSLGSPNTAWVPRLLGGMTGDGAVVAVTFANSATGGIGQIAGLFLPSSNRGGYLHNSHGWFTLGRALYMSPQAIDLSAAGWSIADLAITGVRTVNGVDLVFGQGTHNGNMEGFVAEFPAGFLAGFDPAANLPLVTNTTLSLTSAAGSAINYTVTGTHATTFGATGLPAGLSINPSTGLISGTTTVIGTLQVTITASNALGDVDSKTLVLNLTGPARFYGMGDLTGGGIASSVRDATRVAGTVYAVGSGTARVQVVCTNSPTNTIPPGCVANVPPLYNLDSSALWSWAGLGPLTVAVLPEGPLVNHTLDATPVVNQMSAYAITPSATFIASQAHFTQDSTANSAVRVDRSLLPSTTANRNLGAAGSPALSLSDDGTVVYTTQSNGSRRAVVGVSVTVSTLTGVGGEALSFPTPRGSSSNGSVMVGTSWASGSYTGTNGHAFRYVEATGTSAIPTLTDGSWNFPIAVSSNGTVTLVAGSSPLAPNGEIYLYDAAADQHVPEANGITRLGSPNTAWFPRLLGGMTADGVVAVTFANNASAGTGGATTGIPATNKYAYVHNSHGWFHLSSALAAQGVDLVALGWDPTNLAITSVRTVEGVDLVSGQGRRRTVGATNYVDGAVEGFVAEFPAGYLAAYDPTPTPPTNKAIVGAWALGGDPTNANFVVAFMNDGTYYQIVGGATGGFERGLYSWAADGSYRLWSKQADGTGGSAASNGRLGRSIAIAGNTLTITDAYCPVCAATVFTRITGATNTLVGGWVFGDSTIDSNSAMLVLLGGAVANTGKYFLAQEFGNVDDHVEIGTWTWNPTNPATLSWSGITQTQHAVLSAGIGSVDPALLTADELGLVVGTAPNIFSLRRVLDPATVPPVITNSTLTASGATGAAFGGYTVTATHGLTFSALGLPPGLAINSTTGQITGAPTQTGTFNVTITATNTLGTTDSRTLVITIALGATVFQGIGDLANGGVGSAVRDATRVGGTIYAVGASTISNNTLPVPNLDTPALWTWPGSGSGTLSALPTGVTLTTHPGNSISAYAITKLATFIASQAHYTDGSNTSNWVRVDVSQLPAGGNLNLSTASGTGAFAALALSDNGTTVYGQRTDGAANVATRYQSGVGGGFNQPPLPPGTAWSFPVPRGTSADGLVMVGVASPAAFGGTGTGVFPMATNTTAFRYVHNAGTLTGTTTAIPPLVTGGWNFPIAVSAGGDVALVAGNSAAVPNGEVYLYNTPAIGPPTTTSLGSPNTAWTPRLLGGMTADGSVVAVTFSNSPNGGPAGISGLGLPTGPNQKYAYLHNSHGWFHLSSALAAQGIDLAQQGWDPTNLLVTGIRTVENVDLVFGQGRRRTVGVTNVPQPGDLGYIDGEVEGFVAEFPAGYLATVATTPTPPADASIVGAWGLGANADTAALMYVFMNDGTYYEIGAGGFDRGVYTWGENGAYRIWSKRDTDGTGISNFNGNLGRTLSISGDTITITDTNCPGCPQTMLTRVMPQAGSLAGGWLLGDATVDDSSALLVLTGTASGGKYFYAQDLDDQDDHSEVGTWARVVGSLAVTGITANRNGQQQSVPNFSPLANLTGDELGLVVDDAGTTFTFSRVVNPATVVPVIGSPLTADAVVGESFTYSITAFHGLTFDATSLPPWLSIDTATGALSGTPPATGTDSLTIYASNSIGGTGSASLVITTRNHQAPLVVNAQASAAYAVTFTAGTSGGNGTGDVTFTTSGGCTNTGGGGDITMTSGTLACSITATKAADGSFTQAISDAILVSAEKRAASVTPNLAAKDFGAGDPTLTGTLDGFLAADHVTATYSRTSGETVAGGPYTISATLSATGDLSNYDITYNTAAFTINAAAQATLSVQVPQPTAVYGSTFSVTPNGGSGVGLVTYAASGACTNSAGSADITMVSGTGTCAIIATKASDGSYALAVSNAADVTAQPLAASVTPSPASKVVGGVDPALSGTLSGFLAGDNITATYARAVGEAEGPYTISATLAPAGALSNYAITYNTAVFTINPPAPSVQVLAPNGGERVFVGVPTMITWAATGATVSFDVELSRNNGGTYTPIAGCVGLPAGTTSCAWTPTTPASTTALIRVTAHPAAGPVSDSSDAVFTIVNAAPSVTVTAPNTAVNWTVGTTQSITWNHNLGASAPVSIELSRNNGASWETLSASTVSSGATNGSFSWLVTGPAANASALVRVNWLNGSASDVSNVAFTIAGPAVTVTAPNTLVTWRSGTAHNITFTHNLGVGQPFDISLSRDGGVTWSPIATFTTTAATTGSYSWTTDGPATMQARVRVAWANGAGVTDDSDVDFIVSSRVIVTSPNTALTWAAGTVRTITWTHNLLASDTMDISFSPDGGATWQPIASSVPNSSATNGSYTGALPATPTGQGLIRVNWAGHPAEFDVSDVVFTLVAPTVAVTAPNTNVAWVIGSHHNITWTHNLGTGESVRLEVSRNGGATWSDVAASVVNSAASSGTFDWLVDGPVTTAARIRASWTKSGVIQDVSDIDFSVTSAITVTAPNTAVIWAAGSTRTITWNHSLGAAAAFDVAVSPDSGASWLPIAAGVPAATATTGTFTGLLPAVQTTQALIRVSPAGLPTSGDVSNVVFTLAAPGVAITAPNTAVGWIVGTHHNITWTHNLGTAESVRLDVSRDGGATWSLLSASVANGGATSGTFDWLLDAPLTNTARVRATWTRNGTVQDASDVNFSVTSPITVTAPNTAVTWAAGSTRTITWNHSLGAAATFDIDFSPDNGVTWTSMAAGVLAATATTGTFTAPMPATQTTLALIRVSPAGSPLIGDASNVTFTLAAPVITVTAPNTNVTWTIASLRNITWSHNLGTADAMKIEVSRNGGATWTVVASSVTNTAATTGTFAWTVNGPATTTAQIRITWASNAGVSDVSNVNFKIQ